MTAASPRRWVWFFVLLALPLPFVITIPIWYNLRQQLDPERLAAARQRWREHGPRDYVVDYAVRHEYNPEPGGRTPERYAVTVRDGKARSVTGAGGRELTPGEYDFATMEELFDLIERQLREAAEEGGRRPFMIGVFGREDGHVARYRRSVVRTRELFEVEAKLRAENPPDAPAGK